MDFSNFKLSQQYYGGSERKIGVIIRGREYMLKFQKSSPFGIRYNHISEHLGSKIFSLLGFSVQDTILGTYKNEPVVACRNFIGKDELYVPFNDVGESSLDQDKDGYQYTYEDIMQMLRDNSKLTHVEETIAIFWEMFIVDAFLGNFDRHGSNWGFIKKNYEYRLAPIFDNGSCLFPNMADEAEMLHIINSAEETDKRIFSFPTSQIKLQGQKSSYYEIIHSLMFPECNTALIKIFNRIDLTVIFKLIDELKDISEIHQSFYKHMIQERYTKIIKSSYDLLRSQL
jgi:hypothetical protein